MLYADQVKERVQIATESIGVANKKSETQKNIKMAKQRHE